MISDGAKPAVLAAKRFTVTDGKEGKFFVAEANGREDEVEVTVSPAKATTGTAPQTEGKHGDQHGILRDASGRTIGIWGIDADAPSVSDY